MAQQTNEVEARIKIAYGHVIGLFVIILGLFVLGWLLPDELNLPEWVTVLIAAAVGAWIKETSGTNHFLFGSSSGSKAKDLNIE